MGVISFFLLASLSRVKRLQLGNGKALIAGGSSARIERAPLELQELQFGLAADLHFYVGASETWQRRAETSRTVAIGLGWFGFEALVWSI